jgi:hypothetical protein
MLRKVYLASLRIFLLAGCTSAASVDKSRDSKKLRVVILTNNTQIVLYRELLHKS